MTRELLSHKKLLIVVTLLFMAILVAETLYLIALRRQLDSLTKELESLGKRIEPITLKVNLLVKYDNGTKIWFNNTLVPVGWTLFNLTFYVSNGRVDYKVFPTGIFVTAITGVSQHGNYFWLWYRWDLEKRDWVLGETGPDACLLRNGDVLAWYLADTSKYPNIDKP